MALLTLLILLTTLHATLGEDCIIDNTPEHMAWEKVLRKDLKCNYQIFTPPNGTTSSLTITVRFTMKYFYYDSVEEVFSVQNWMFISWKDDRLEWDPEKYYGIKETEVSSISIWTPSLRLFNSADSNDYDRFFFVRCHVKHTGVVLCVPKVTHESKCAAKLAHWPHDVQECSLEFGPWAPMNFKMNFSSRAITMLGAEYGAEWFISDYRQETNHSSERQLKMVFVLEREAAGLAAIIIHPAVVLTALTITALFLDVRRNVRLWFACFSLLSHYYFLRELAENIPKESSDPPNVLLYYRGSIVLTFITVLLTFALTKLCKLKSPPQNYIISVNNFVYESYRKYFIVPQWDFDVESKGFHEDWTKFVCIVNNVFVYIIFITYISLYAALIPQPVPINY